MDGLDPMLAWTMGSTTGHTTVALWDRRQSGDVLMICESTAKDSYWPTNGIQCTQYDVWMAQAKEAGFNAVHLPLISQYRSAFNETAAWEWFHSVEGVDYG
jgi:hypothetical protein